MRSVTRRLPGDLSALRSLHALDDASQFSLFQLVRVLRGALAAPRGGKAGLRFRGDYSLAFPASDVGGAALDEGAAAKTYHVTVRGAGLGGAGSPLPGHYAESWGRQDSAAARAAALLDTTSHHVMDLLYRTWADPRRIACDNAGTHDHIAAALLAAMGGLDGAQAGAAEGMLAEAAARLRTNLTAASAGRRLTRAFGGIPVSVVANVRRRVNLPTSAMTKLGRTDANNRLGGTFRLGRSVVDAKGKFRVVMGPAPMAALERFTDPRSRRQALGGVIEQALGTPLCHEVEIRFGNDLSPLGLTGRSRLGVTSHLGKVMPVAGCVSVVLPEGPEGPEGTQGGRHEHE